MAEVEAFEDHAAAAAQGRKIDLSWPRPAGTAGDYHLYWFAGDHAPAAAGELTQMILVQGESYAHTNLRPETYYSYAVAAVNAAGVEGDWSPIAYARTGAAPTFHGSTTSVSEGQPNALTVSVSRGTFTDAAIDHWTIDWGDGSDVTTLPVSASGSASHTFADGPIQRHVTATAYDAAGHPYPAVLDDVYQSDWLAVNVQDVAPVLLIGGASSIGEGQPYELTLQLDATQPDPGQDTITAFQIDWGDGSALQTVAAEGGGVPAGPVPHVFADGPTATDRIVRAWAVDEDGPHEALTTRSVQVRDVPPVLTLGGAASVVQGETYTLNLAAADVPADAATNWTISWGDGTSSTLSGNPATATHAYAHGSPTPFTVTATAANKDASATASKSVTVQYAQPTVAQAASASPNPVTGTTATLSVLGALPAPGIESDLTYTWSVSSAPTGAPSPTFGAGNGTNAGKSLSVTFHKAGTYAFEATIRNANTSVKSSVSVSVEQTLTSLAVSPVVATVPNDSTQQFTATGRDQFGDAMPLPEGAIWAIDDAALGTISAGGLLTTHGESGSTTVRVSAGGKAATASVQVGDVVTINFDDLDVGTVVTDQYPLAVFSADAGKMNQVMSDGWSAKALGTYPIGDNHFDNNLYVDFPIPVNGLRFRNGYQNPSDGQRSGTVRVFTDGQLAASVPIAGAENAVGTVDLAAYHNVTRIEIVDVSMDVYGLVYDDFTFTPAKVDLDVDSDDTNGLSPPDRTQAEDDIEADPDRVLKLIATNDDDADADYVPGYADGYNLVPNSAADDAANDRFVPVVVEVPFGVDPSKATLTFSYDANDPYNVVPQDDGTYLPGAGRMRLWAKDGNVPRNGHEPTAGGDFIAAGVAYKLSDLGITAENRTKTLYVEAIRRGDRRGDTEIGVSLDADGPDQNKLPATNDRVLLLAVDVDVLIGASNASDESLNDDWVGAADGTRVHKIFNYLRIQGPEGLAANLSLDTAVPGNTGGSVTFEQDVNLTPFTGTDGLGLTAPASFVIAGGAVSTAADNIVVRASLNGVVFGSQTITVIRFAAEKETYGDSPIPVNPVIVTFSAPDHRGNLFAADTGVRGSQPGTNDWHKNITPGGAVKPNLLPSKKISPDKIEVVWGRVFNPNPDPGDLLTSWLVTSEQANSGLIVNPMDNGLNNNPDDNLRMRDDGTGITVSMGANPRPIHYVLGHPTQSSQALLSVKDNYTAMIEAEPRNPITFPVAVHVMRLLQPGSGAVLGQLNLAPAQVDAIIADLNTVWSQAGIQFTLPAGNRFEPQDTEQMDQFDVNDSDHLGRSTHNVTAINNVANSIDIYFVRRIGESSGQGDIAGTTIFQNPATTQKAGILVARETTSANNIQTRQLSAMARTLAHEMGHYLLKVGNSGHSTNPWNIMYVDADTKLDISGDPNAPEQDQVGTARRFNPTE